MKPQFLFLLLLFTPIFSFSQYSSDFEDEVGQITYKILKGDSDIDTVNLDDENNEVNNEE